MLEHWLTVKSFPLLPQVPGCTPAPATRAMSGWGGAVCRGEGCDEGVVRGVVHGECW